MSGVFNNLRYASIFDIVRVVDLGKELVKLMDPRDDALYFLVMY